MNLDTLNKWITPLANLGVLGGLPMVAVQMNLNTQAIKLQNSFELNRGAASAELGVLGDTTHIALATAMLNPSELTDAQMMQLWSYQNVITFSVENQWIAYQDGLVTKEARDRARQTAVSYFGFRAAARSGGERAFAGIAA